jgi:hypothetical protein
MYVALNRTSNTNKHIHMYIRTCASIYVKRSQFQLSCDKYQFKRDIHSKSQLHRDYFLLFFKQVSYFCLSNVHMLLCPWLYQINLWLNIFFYILLLFTMNVHILSSSILYTSLILCPIILIKTYVSIIMSKEFVFSFVYFFTNKERPQMRTKFTTKKSNFQKRRVCQFCNKIYLLIQWQKLPNKIRNCCWLLITEKINIPFFCSK